VRIILLGDIRPTHLKRWREYFRSRGHEVETVSLEVDKSDSDYRYLKSWTSLSAVKYFLKRKDLKRIIAEFKPDIINAHFLPSYGLLAVASGFHPVVVSLWGSDILISAKKTGLHRKRALWVLGRADLVTSDSVYMTQETRALGNFQCEMLTEPMGVTREFFESVCPEKEHIEEQPLQIISTRRLEPLYDVEILLKALDIVSRDLPEYRCIICGDGSQRKFLERVAAKLNLYNVEFRGWLQGDEYSELYRNSDIYLSCSKSDSTSVSLLEAMAAGVFPVISNIPGNTEWVTDNQTALTFPTGEPKVLAAALLQAARDTKLRDNAAVKNRKKVESLAIWEENMARIERAFSELVERTH